jgi:Tfp pilus assembly protein PilV
MVATLIMAIVLVSVGGVLINSMLSVAYNRQRTEAVNLANQTVEEVRSLASSSTGWTTILDQGMKASDPDNQATPVNDPNIANGCFEGKPIDITGTLAAGCSSQAPLSWQDRSTCTTTVTPPSASTLSSPAPLQPHESCYFLDHTTYIVDAYLTGTNTGTASVAAAAPLTLTVVVSWTRPDVGVTGTAADRVSTATALAGCSVQVTCS